MTTVAISGHRPEKLPEGFDVYAALTKAFKDLEVTYLYQGMAAGVDLISSYVAYKNQIPYTCAKPWAGHKARKDWANMYYNAEKHAEEIVNVNESEKYIGAWLYETRNRYMVDHAELVIAVWDGTSGGTGNCVGYAYKKRKKVWCINPITEEVGWFD